MPSLLSSAMMSPIEFPMIQTCCGNSSRQASIAEVLISLSGKGLETLEARAQMLVREFLMECPPRRTFARRHLLRRLPNLLPQFVASGAGFGRERKQTSRRILLG